MESHHTEAATHAALTDHDSLKPEWLRVPQATRVFSLSRSALYRLIAAGKIESICLREQGTERGSRLIRYDSLAAFLENAARAGGEVTA